MGLATGCSAIRPMRTLLGDLALRELCLCIFIIVVIIIIIIIVIIIIIIITAATVSKPSPNYFS